MTALVAIHVCATWFMVGLIWLVQTVHYPLFARVGSESFVDYETEHTRRIGRLLALPALIEVATAAGLIWASPAQGFWLVVVSAALLAGLWLTTLFVQVPLHRQLSRSWAAPTMARLVRTNWLRTVGWSIRGILVFAILLRTI